MDGLPLPPARNSTKIAPVVNCNLLKIIGLKAHPARGWLLYLIHLGLDLRHQRKTAPVVNPLETSAVLIEIPV
jgi:hypothetical protein